MALRLTSMDNLFLEQLQEIYSAEHQLISALPRLAEAVQSEPLQKRFFEHQLQAKEQVAHLELIFAERGEKLRGRKSLGMAGILQEGFYLIEKPLSPEMVDAGLNDIARKAELYQVACYGAVRAYASVLGYEKETRSLRRILHIRKRAYRCWNQQSSPVR